MHSLSNARNYIIPLTPVSRLFHHPTTSQPASQFLAISLEKSRKRSDVVESSDLSLSLSSTVSWHSKRNSSTFGTFLNGNELPPSLQSRCRSGERSSAIDNERIYIYFEQVGWRLSNTPILLLLMGPCVLQDGIGYWLTGLVGTF